MSERNVVVFDAGELRNLRREAELNSVDFSRARIVQARTGGYVVELDPPLFPLGDVLADAPSSIDARTAAMAEGEMLTWLMRIQRAERTRLRSGRAFGLSSDQLVRRPLTSQEVSEFIAHTAHQREVKRLQNELRSVLEDNAKAAAASAGTADLAARYHVAPSKAEPEPAPRTAAGAAKLKRAPSRGAKA